MKLCIVELHANSSFFFLLPKPVGKKSNNAPVAFHSTTTSAFFTNTFFMDWIKHQMNKTKNKCLTVNTNKILLKHLHLFKHYPYMIPT